LNRILSRLALLLLAALCVGGHLHQVLGQYAMHDHHGHDWSDAETHHEHGDDADHQDTGRSGADHFLAEHGAVAVVFVASIFKPLIVAVVAMDDEATQRLPKAQPQLVELPPRSA
jgi:hypothetical protein